MTAADQPGLRWYDYVFATNNGSSRELIRDAAKDSSRVLLVCGAGFDPRSLDVPRMVAGVVSGELDVVALEPGVAGEHADASASASANGDELAELFGENLHVIEAPEVADPATLGLVLSRQLEADFGVLGYDTVLVDMSGLPSSISFTLIHLLLEQSSARASGQRFAGNLLVTVAEDASTDERIVATGLGPAGILSGFRRLDENRQQTIWVPVLGHKAAEELRALVTFLGPNEVCPVVPFPSSDPLRGDGLLVEHRTLLFDELKFEPRNVLYASESNPFDLYRQLVWLAQRYRLALDPLGGATIVVSEHASKLLSLGVLLAAHEADIVVGHVRPMSYRLEPDQGVPRKPEVHAAWLTGQPYQKSSEA